MVLVCLLRNGQFYLRFYAGYKYTDHNQNVFTSFEHTNSSDRTRYMLLIFSKFAFALKTYTVRGNLILELRELELISNSSFIKLSLFVFDNYEIFIIIIPRTYF